MHDERVTIMEHSTYILIKNANLYEGSNGLKKNLSVWNPYTFSYDFLAYLEIDETDDIIIPGGYNTENIYKYFPDAEYINKRMEYDDYREQKKYALLAGAKNELQNKAINFLKRNIPQKYLALQTGQGKTYCAINYIHSCRKIPIIIMDQESILLQWKESIMKFTSIREDEIYIISGQSSIAKLYKMSKKELKDIQYFLAIHKTISTVFENGGLDSLKRLFSYIGTGLKVYDEAHQYWKNIFYVGCAGNIETIYLSATPGRININEEYVYKRMYYSIPKHATNFTSKYFNIVLYNINTSISTLDELKLNGKRGFDSTAYSKYLISDSTLELFQDSITNILRKLYRGNFKKEKKIFYIFKLKAQIDIAYETIQEYLKDYDNDIKIGILTGDTKRTEKREVLENNIVLTTDSSFSKALDVENLEIVVNYAPVASTDRLNQMVGRLRELPDKEVFFVDVIDNSVSLLTNMSKKRINYYKQIAKKIYNMNGTGVEKC